MAEITKIALSEEDVREMINALKKVPHYREYLQMTMERDKERFFQCQPEEQQIVRGAYLRTQFELNQLADKVEVKKKGLGLPRYS